MNLVGSGASPGVGDGKLCIAVHGRMSYIYIHLPCVHIPENT